MLISFEVPLGVLFGLAFLVGAWVGAYVSREIAEGKRLQEEYEATHNCMGIRKPPSTSVAPPFPKKPKGVAPPKPEYNPHK